MSPPRILLLVACWLPAGIVPVACQRAPARKNVPVSPLADQFKDTTLATVSRATTAEFDTGKPAHRDSLRAELNRHRALWRAAAPKDYRYLLLRSCFCPGQRGWLLIEVRAGQPLKAWDRTGKAVPVTDWDTISIDKLFDDLELAVDREASVRLGFDPRWHFPTYVATTYRPGPDAWGITEARALKPI